MRTTPQRYIEGAPTGNEYLGIPFAKSIGNLRFKEPVAVDSSDNWAENRPSEESYTFFIILQARQPLFKEKGVTRRHLFDIATMAQTVETKVRIGKITFRIPTPLKEGSSSKSSIVGE